MILHLLLIVNESCVVSVAYFSHFWYIMSDFIVLEIISRKLIEVEVDEGHGLHYPQGSLQASW